MNKFILFIVFVLFSLIGKAQPTTSWANKFYSSGNNHPHDIKVDTVNQMIYVGGRMKFGGYTFIGNDTITTPYYGKKDAFIAKYTISGELVWANTVGSVNDEETSEVAFDIQGNAYICGNFRDTLYYGTDTLFSNGLLDVFIIKFDNEGNVMWGRNFGGNKHDFAKSIEADFYGNVYIAGSVESSFNYEGSPVNGTGGELFILKLAANGDLIWVKSSVSNGSNTKIIGKSIRISSDSTLFVMGNFKKTMTFSDSTVVSQGGEDIFVLKLNVNGEINWLRSFGGKGSDIGGEAAVSNNDDLVLNGYFSDTILVNGQEFINEGGLGDILIAQYSSIGELSWFRNYGGPGFFVGDAISVDKYGNCFMAGYGHGQMTQSEDTLVYSETDPHIVLISLDSNGQHRWVKQYGSDSYSRTYGIACDQYFNVYYSGMFISEINLDTVHLITNNPNQFWTNSFIAKLYQKLPLGLTTNKDILCFGDTVEFIIDDYFAWVDYMVDIDGGQLISQANDTLEFVVSKSGYLNAMIYADRGVNVDSILMDSIVFVYPEVDLLLADKYICQGDSTVIELQGDFESILWSTGDTTQSLIVSEADTFYVSIIDSNLCTTSDTVSVFVFEPVVLNLTDEYFCPGDSAVISLPDDLLNILWSTGDTTSSIIVYSENTLFVSAIDTNYCIINDTISVYTFPILDLNLQDETICQDDSVTMELIGEFESILWSNGDTSAIVTFYNEGVYSVLALDLNGCTSSDTLAVFENALPEPDLGNDTLLCEGEIYTLTTSEFYQEYLWNDGSMDDYITVDQAGVYSVVVHDINNCAGADTIIIQYEVCVGIRNNQLSEFQVYPNPATTVLTISLSLGLIGKEIRLFNTQGELVFSKQLLSKINQIDVSRLSQGVYFYKIGNDESGGKLLISK